MKTLSFPHIIMEWKKGAKPMPEFTHDGIQMYFDEYGTGTPIVFIHPPAMGRKVFHFQVGLKDHFRVIFPDLSGHGDTKGPAGNVSLKGYADEIMELLHFLQIEKAVLCGYSAGGLIAQEFALVYPEKTLGIILAGGYPEIKSIGFKYEHIAGMYFVKHFPNLLAKVICASHTNDKKIIRTLYEHMMKADRQTWFQFYEHSLHYSCISRLHQLDAPLFLVYGSRDFMNQHLRIYERYLSPKVAIVPGISHQLPTKKWEMFNHLITGFIKDGIEKKESTESYPELS